MSRICKVLFVTLIIYFFCFPGFSFGAADVPEEIQLTTQNIFIKNNRVLEPATLNSNLGTTVVWINISSFPVEIIFLGKKVTLACGSPINFSIDKDGAFHSAIIPRGGTASLCFIERGTFTYKIESSGTLLMEYGKKERKVSKGTIVIQ
jgi:hypothetical protein